MRTWGASALARILILAPLVVVLLACCPTAVVCLGSVGQPVFIDGQCYRIVEIRASFFRIGQTYFGQPLYELQVFDGTERITMRQDTLLAHAEDLCKQRRAERAKRRAEAANRDDTPSDPCTPTEPEAAPPEDVADRTR